MSEALLTREPDPTMDDYKRLYAEYQKKSAEVEQLNEIFDESLHRMEKSLIEHQERAEDLRHKLEAANAYITGLEQKRSMGSPIAAAHRWVCLQLNKLGSGYKTKLLAVLAGGLAAGQDALLQGQLPFIPDEIQVALYQLISGSVYGKYYFWAGMIYLIVASYDARRYKEDEA